MKTAPDRYLLGKILVELGHARDGDVARALEQQKTEPKPIGELLLRERLITIEQLAAAVQLQKRRRREALFRRELLAAREFAKAAIAAGVATRADMEKCLQAMVGTFKREDRLHPMSRFALEIAGLSPARIAELWTALLARTTNCAGCGAVYNAAPGEKNCRYCEAELGIAD